MSLTKTANNNTNIYIIMILIEKIGKKNLNLICLCFLTIGTMKII